MLPWLILLCCLQAGVLEVGATCDDDTNIAFSGGYLSLEWQRRNPSSTSFKKITFKFKPTNEFGVLFFMEFQLKGSLANSSSLVSVLSHNGSSILLSEPKEQPNPHDGVTAISSISSTSDNRVTLHIHNNKVLRIRAKGENWHNYRFKGDIDVKSLIFGGAKDFTAYSSLPVRNYFVGTLTNFTMGKSCIGVVELNKLSSSQAIVQDNCRTAVPSFIEFNAFSRPLPAVTVQPTTHLRVNFTIAAKHCVGEILHLEGGSFVVELSASKLITTITNSSGHSSACISSEGIELSRWINVMVTYINDTVRYFINDEESGSCYIDLGIVNFTGTMMVGASNNMSASFTGHLRHLYWDNSEINLIGLAMTDEKSCVGIGPIGCGSVGLNTTFFPSCPICALRDFPIHWATFDVSIRSNLTVDENKESAIASDDFILSYGGSQCLTNMNLQKLWKNIKFTLLKSPTYGKLEHTFTLEDVSKDGVYYNHLGEEEETDVIDLHIQVHCGTLLLYEKSLKMYVHINPINDHPDVSFPQRMPLSIVVGTRKVITQSVILMSDVDTSLDFVRCIDTKVEQNGTTTGQFEWADKPGDKITEPFYQRHINDSMIVLRLFLDAVGLSKVALTIYDGDKQNFKNFEVSGDTGGKIMLMTNKSAKVVENGTVSIDNLFLIAGTNLISNYQYQYPVIVTYVLTSFPEYGELSVAHNQSFVERNVSRFTQFDIDNKLLSYSHIIHVQNSTEDCFTFKLMVDDFEGENDEFCVTILIEDHVPKLVLNITIPQNITLREGEEKLITNDDLFITSGLELNGQLKPLPSNIAILIQILEPPKYGHLYLNSSNGTKRIVIGNNVSLTQLESGLLAYGHGVDEEHQDSFIMQIIIHNFSPLLIQSPPISSMKYVVSIDITAINNKFPLIQVYEDINIIEGSYEYLTASIINITDADRPVENLTVYVIPKVPFNGHFAKLDNYSVAISHFSVNQIINREIVFKHYLGNKLEGSCSLVVSDGLHNSSSEIKVIAEPVTLEVSATHSIEQCSLSLDLEESSSVNIHTGLFSIDRLNSGNPPNIQINTTVENCVYFNNGTNIFPVTNFTKRDIDQGNIWYIVKDRKTRESKRKFGLNFFIGHAKPVYVQFQVCLNLLPYPQLDGRASDLNVSLPKGGDIEINSSVLFSMSAENHTTLLYELLVPPTHGELIMQFKGLAVMFTQHDVNAGKIYYNNHNYSRHGDKFVLTLSNQYYNRAENVTVGINIFLLNLEVVNNGFTVKEGGSHTIDSNELYATGPEKQSIMFYIDVKPIYGKIVFKNDLNQTVSSFSRDHINKGQVLYINDGQEFNHDIMKIKIEAVGNNETPSHINDTAYFGTVHISVELVNDNAPREWNVSKDLIIVDGDSFIVTQDILSFQDDDSDMDISQLKYTVFYGPMYGDLFYGPNKTIIVAQQDFTPNKSVITEFLQQDIYDMQIGYQSNKRTVANGDKYVEICGLSISDGVHEVPHFFTFNITPFAIESKTNKKLSLDEGEEKVLSDKNLLFVAAKAKPPVNDSEYIYEIISQPIHGHLVMRNSCNCFFTQEELRNGSVMYSHDDSDTINDNFTFVVIVRGFKTAVMTYIISISPVDDQSPSVTYSDMLIVHFDEAVYFNKSVLEATDDEAGSSNLMFTVLEKPSFGSIKRQKTGPGNNNTFVVEKFTQLYVDEEAIFYQHESEEDGKWIDKVILSLSDGRNVYNKRIEITFVLIPRQLPIRVHGIKLREGQIVPLATHNFEVTHPYLSALELYIHVTKTVDYGDLLLLYQNPIKNFTSTELKNGTILYFNGEDNEKIEDTFKFVAKAGGISSEEQTFVFTIESVNDEHPVIIYNSIISLWAGEVKSISKDNLFTNDSDAYPADKLEYIINVNTSFGHFAYKGAHQTAITKFSQDDIVAGIVVFRSFGTVNDTEIEINFTVTDGKHNVKSFITFEINVLKIKVNPQHITVAMGADQLISFSPDINDDSEERMLHYHVQSAGEYGVIMNTVTGLEVTNFTQGEIESQQIVYKHTAVDRYETIDTVNFNVSTDLAKTVEVSLNVTIILKSSSTSYLAASESLAVDEGGTVCLNESILDASNVLYEVWKSNQSVALHELTIQYIIASQPFAGELKSGNASIDKYFEHSDMKSPNGVCYHHNDSETTRDHFSVKINISYNSTDVWYSNSTVVPIQIDIRPLNDEHPEVEFVDKMCVYKFDNYTAVIRQKDLYIHDKDTAAEELVIVISNQSGVECSVGDVPTHNFTQDDINNEKVKCMLPRSVDSSNLTFYFTDGNFISDNKIVYYSKIVITLSIAHNVSKLNYPQEKGLGGVTLTNKYLNSSTTGRRSDTVYIVTASPVNGDVLRLNRTVDSFTQLDIDNRMIQYKATNNASYSDAIAMRVTNRDATPQHVTLHVTAMAMIDSNNVTIMLSSINNSQPLPPTLFNTMTLVNLSNPTFTVLNKLSYGHFNFSLAFSSAKRSSELFSFDSIQLREWKVLYVLGDKNVTNGTEVLQLSIKPNGMQAGFKEAFFSISVQPSMPTRTLSPSTPPVDLNQSSGQRGSSFTLVALVPIIGVPSFILIVVIILVGFWYSQRLKEKKRCAAALGSSAICMKTPAFKFPIAYNTDIATDFDNNSERINSDHSSNNSDEGISMALPLEDQIEDEGMNQRYMEDSFQSRPHHYPLTPSVYSASGYNTPIPHYAQQLPILKNEEYWI